MRAAVERRPPPSGVLARQAATPSSSPARALQERLGNRGAQALLSRSVAAPAREGQPSALSLKVSSPTDRAELEADEAARKVTRMHGPAAAPAVQAGKPSGVVARAAAPPTAPPASTGIDTSGGAPLPAAVRSHMEPRFGASFANVRIHTGEPAARQSAAINAHAFTVGQHVFFGRDRFQPQTAAGQHLIAHELAHTIQQGATVQRDVLHRFTPFLVSERSPPRPQRSSSEIRNPRESFAAQVAGIPGFTMLTVVVGHNPITNASVERTPANILRGAIQLMPGGAYITDALTAHGLFDRLAAWVAARFETLRDIAADLWNEIERFLHDFHWTDLADLGGLWDRARAIVERPITRVIAFARTIRDDVVRLIKEAVLRPIAAFARTTRGYPLLCAVMGRDPITGDSVPQTAESLLGAFLRFIGEGSVWEAIQRAHAIPRTLAWFRGAMQALSGFVHEIPGLFLQAWRALDVADIILVPRAFARLAGVFGGFAGRFVTWGASAVWSLLEIVFDVVSPGALAYVKRTGAALRSILRNPLPFVGNLVRAAKLGFLNFADHFGTHLRNGLLNWLTGALPGVYIPRALSLIEIAKFVFSVLGLTWTNIRQKLVRATSETVVKALETGFDIVVTLVREGPAAAWDKIKEQLSNLKDMVIGGITDFVVDTVVKKAIPKLVSMFIPGAGFVSAILSIYDTIMVFVNRLSQIVQVVTGFIDSIVAIAAGQIVAAATRVENILANLFSLALNFLAGFAGLGNVADKILGVIARVRAPVDRALDALIAWIVNAAKRLFNRLFGKKDERTEEQRQADLAKAMAEAEAVEDAPGATEDSIKAALPAIQRKYRVTSLDLIVDGASDKTLTVHISGSMSPPKRGKRKNIPKAPGSKSNPIILNWVKPPINEYPSITYVVGNKKKQAHPLGKASVGGLTIGVTYPDALKIKDGAKIQVQPPVTGNDPAKKTMNRVLNANGYDRTQGQDAPRDTDHIVEKQLGGPDDVGNLWPLNQSKNKASGPTVRGEISRILTLYNWKKRRDLNGKWIKLKF